MFEYFLKTTEKDEKENSKMDEKKIMRLNSSNSCYIPLLLSSPASHNSVIR